MRVGVVGLGKLGCPVAVAIDSRGHDVCGYDVNPEVETYLKNRQVPYREEGLPELLANHQVRWCDSIKQVVEQSDLIFMPIQTPHAPEFEGDDVLPNARMDFDYTYLRAGVEAVATACAELGERKTLAVISTCLPGTFSREIEPLLNEFTSYVYSPGFIAMGTVIFNYFNPEFNLIGVQDEAAADLLEEFYSTINDAPCVRTDVTTAEGIKISYNSIITAKTVLANTWGELSERLGMDFGAIKKTWDLSTKRLLSPRYLDAGMSDGGGCFPPGEWVTTEHGPRAIETISVGDRVLTIDGTLQPVIKTWERQYDGDLVTVTAHGTSRMTTDHPVITESGEALAEDLTTDHQLTWPWPYVNTDGAPHTITYNHNWAPISSIERIPYSGPVHNLWVANNNTYVVSCGAVHNCHPRDNIAMSWLAGEVGMSHNLWDDLMQARQSYESWHADVAVDAAEQHELPLVLLGKAFKPETDIETGSAAILMANILRRRGVQFLHVNDLIPLTAPAVYFIATKNARYADYQWPVGSVVLDPFGLIPDREGVEVVRMGRR